MRWRRRALGFWPSAGAAAGGQIGAVELAGWQWQWGVGAESEVREDRWNRGRRDAIARKKFE